MTASVLSHYLPASLFDATSAAGRRTLHNLAQAAHCAAQGKVGSGFDVAAAVYGSSRYRRFSPSVLTGLPEPGAPGFGAALVALVDGASWDVEVDKQAVGVPPGLSLRMCDVDCGSQTVSMVKKVLAWKDGGGGRPAQLWDDLQARNEALGAALSAGDLDALPARVAAVRELVREMGQLSDVPIEPESQTKLLDAVSEVDGVFGGVVPGAGGFDAVALLLRDDAETERRVKDFLAAWSRDTGAKVKLLEVKGEMDGVRQESLDLYTGWIPGRSE
jgi:phosphomevalonate kinase